MKKISVILFCTFLGSIRLFAQDFTFSQFYESPLLRNPALAGIMHGDIRIVGAERSQWGAVTVPFETQALSVELRIPIGRTKDFITTSAQITNDVAGDSKLGRLQILPAITYSKSLNNIYDETTSFLNFSIMGGLVQSQFDPSKLVFNDQYVQYGQPLPVSPTAAFNKTSIAYGDLSSGISFCSNNSGIMKYYIGIAGFHLIRSKVGFYNNDNILLKPRYVVNGGFNMRTGDADRFYVYADYNLQGGNRQFLLGVLYKKNIGGYDDDDDEPKTTSLTFGGTYRWGDAFIPNVKFIKNKIFIGTSYDINLSKLKTASQLRGGLEFSAGFISNLNMFANPGVACPDF